MQVRSSVLIQRPPEAVWRFLGDPANVSKWDRGVAAVESSPAPLGVGFKFDTVAHPHRRLPDAGRMSYRIGQIDPIAGKCVVELISRSGNARFFREAAWEFHVTPAPKGTSLTCTARFKTHWRFLLLGLLLYFKRQAIQMDLEYLKQAIESQAA